MTCKSCNHQFCWVCLSDWDGSHYSCAADAKQVAQSQARGAAIVVENYSFLQFHSIQSQYAKDDEKRQEALYKRIGRELENQQLTMDQARILYRTLELILLVWRSPVPVRFFCLLIVTQGRLLIMNTAITGQYLYANKLPGQRKLKPLLGTLHMNVVRSVVLLNETVSSV